MNFQINSKSIKDDLIIVAQCRIRFFPTLTLKNEMAWVWTTLKNFCVHNLVKIWYISLNDYQIQGPKYHFTGELIGQDLDRIFLNYINNFPLKRLKIGFIIIRTPTCVLMIRTIPNFITVYNILTETISNKSIPDNKFMHIHVFQDLADKKRYR